MFYIKMNVKSGVENKLEFDMKTMCRVCLTHNIDMSALFLENDELLNKIQFCTGILLKDTEGFPTQICKTCTDNLSMACQFKNLCILSEEILMKFIENIKNEVSDDDRCNDAYETNECDTNVTCDIESEIVLEDVHLELRKNNKSKAPKERVNNNKKERQKRYREQNREKLKQREAERRKRIKHSQCIAGPSTSSNTNILEVNNEEIITALEKNRERQRRYKERNRDKLKQREAERRRRLHHAEMITELSSSSSSYIESTEIFIEPIITIDEIGTDSKSVAGLGEMQHVAKWKRSIKRKRNRNSE